MNPLLPGLAPIVDRLGVDRSNCVHTTRDFGRPFKHASGRARSLLRAAPRRLRRWFQGKARVPLLFCENTCLCFPNLTIDIVITNGVPVDVGVTWLGPSIPSGEIKRVLKTGGSWYDKGTHVYQKP